MSDHTASQRMFARLRAWLRRVLHRPEIADPVWPSATLYCVRHPLEHPRVMQPFESYPVGYPNLFGPPRLEPHCSECGALMYVAAAEVVA